MNIWLSEKSLYTICANFSSYEVFHINSFDWLVHMHDLLTELGWEIDYIFTEEV